MVIGILECDYVDSEPKKIYGSYAQMFIKLLSAVSKQTEFKIYQVVGNDFPQNIDECDAYLITGSKSSAYDNEAWIIELKELIRKIIKNKIKLLGICFGHQLIADACGGEVKKSSKGWGVGLMSAKIMQQKMWMKPLVKNYNLLLTHQDQVTVLPEGAELIAGNDFCPNSSYAIGNNVLSFQGHPEFETGYLMYLMNKRKQIIGLDKYNAAKDTLQGDADNMLIAKWMLAFIKL